MHDLLSYKEARIVALLNKIKEQDEERERLTTFIYELCDKDCPIDYKNVVKQEVFR
tara:strand:+ start:1043 stop:1210 length:168 start_codon:yes stop_codon:yes gene_type:complete